MTDQSARPSRRTVLQGAGSLGLAGVVITMASGCSRGGSTAERVSASAQAAVDSLNDDAKNAVKTAITSGQVKDGKPAVLDSVGLIVTKVGTDAYKVFSMVCTHQGAKVNTITGKGELMCPLHGSTFDPKTGDVLVGPANKPLASKDAKMSGGQLTIA